MKNRIIPFGLSIVVLLMIVSCGGDEATIPKSRLYPKITFPERGYADFDRSDCPFTLEYPTYATIKTDKYFEDKEPIHPCWFDILMGDINASIHCSYIPVDGRKHFDKLVSDAFRMVTEHNVKADARRDSLFVNAAGVEGLFFSINGDVATPIQFFITDSVRHFMRGSLYFDDKVNADSIAPLLSFVREDIDHLLESFQWRD